ncbi:MAG: zf-TFIIB domain-containing protein [Dehalococcoidales bacterium]|nr:zf-TFIIB domain-containing protein [Dehalococcoidales bacterium]
MICPACKNDMIVVEYQRIELDFCPQCRGVWFDSGELELMLKSAKFDEASLNEISRLAEVQTTEKTRKCPICRQTMAKNTIGRKSPVLIDVCPRNDGLFFDGGEVHQLITQLPASELGKENPVIDFLSEVFKATG